MEKVPEAPRRSEPAYSFVIYDAKMGQVVQVHHFGAMPGVDNVPSDNHGRHVIHTGARNASYLQLPQKHDRRDPG